MSSTHTELSQDVAFDILSSPRRRYVLYHLRSLDEAIELTNLAEQVAAWENDTQAEKITEQERKRVYVSLYQTHVPRLDEAGIIEYDTESGLITLAEGASNIDGYLDTSESAFPWQRVYLGLAIAGAVLVGLTFSGIAVFGLISMSQATGAVVVTFVLTAIVHTAIKSLQQRSIPVELKKRT